MNRDQRREAHRLRRRGSGRPALVVRAPDGSEAISPFYAGLEVPLCAWDECDAPAREEWHLIDRDVERQANFWLYFCTARHRDLHASGHVHYKRITPEATSSPVFL